MNIWNESNYFMLVISMTAEKCQKSIYETYHYLSQYKGIKFLQEFYDVEHTLNTDDVVDDVLAISERNGGGGV